MIQKVLAAAPSKSVFPIFGEKVRRALFKPSAELVYVRGQTAKEKGTIVLIVEPPPIVPHTSSGQGGSLSELARLTTGLMRRRGAEA